MAQFDLYRLRSGQLVVDLQTDLIGNEASRVVAPWREDGKYTVFPGLTPTVTFEDKTWVVRVQELTAVSGAELRARVWESLFTHDPWRYLRHLQGRMHEASTLILGPSGT